MKTISYAKLQENYAGEFIARKNERIVVHAKTYSQLVKKLTQIHTDRTTVTIGFVPPKSTICIYAC